LKKSTIKKNNQNHHYGSSGECYSFGLRNSYTKLKHASSPSISKYKGDDSIESKSYQQYLENIYRCVYDSMHKYIPGVPRKLNLNCVSMLQLSVKSSMDSIVRNNIDSDMNFLLSANININARTRELHCEKDTTYTTIAIPHQLNQSACIIFEFYLNTHHSLKIKFPSASCFTYSAYCLTHR
jgi:hypothetical protein